MLGTHRSAAMVFKHSGGGSKKHPKKYYLLALDFDGCAAGMFTHTANTDGAGPGTYAIDTNHPIYKHIQNLRAYRHSVILFIGSNRQSDEDDIVRNKHGRCIDAYRALVEELNKDSFLLPVDFCSDRLSDHGMSSPETKFVLPAFHCSKAIAKYKMNLSDLSRPVTYELIDDRGLPTESEIDTYLTQINEIPRKVDFVHALKTWDFMTSLNLLFKETPQWIPVGIQCLLTPFLTFRDHAETLLCQGTSTRGGGVALDASDLRSILKLLTTDAEMAVMDRRSFPEDVRPFISASLMRTINEVEVASEPQPDSDTKHKPSNPSLFCKFAVLECKRRFHVLQSFKNVINKHEISISHNPSKTLHQKIISTENKLNQFFSEAKKIEPNLTILARRLFKSKNLLNEAEALYRACILSSSPVDGRDAAKVNSSSTARLGAVANVAGASAAGQQRNQNSGGGGSKEEDTLTHRM